MIAGSLDTRISDYWVNDIDEMILANGWHERELRRIDSKNESPTVVGGIITVGGGVLHMRGYIWLKKLYIEITKDRVSAGINIKFRV